jgi:glyoxylase-like metal-dependent hydrolase (beta-lactamase superfamily II)
MRNSQLILITHEHLDHINGLTHSPYLDEVAEKTVLTGEQIDNAPDGTGLTPEIIAKITRLEYDQYQQIVPGVVLIKAAGHTPGNQMVYVQLQNGTEYLLVGDVVWTSENLTQLTGRPLLTNLFLGEAPQGHREQVRTLYNISQNEDIVLVISHDKPQLDSYLKQGLLGDRFEF